MKTYSLILLALLCSHNADATATEITLSLKPKQVTNGQVSLLCLQSASYPKTLSVQAGEQKVILIDSPKSSLRCGFVPVPLEHKAATLDVVANWTEQDLPQSKRISLLVKQGKYKENKLSVDPKLTSPSADDQKRIEREQEEINEVYAATFAAPLWQEIFQMPGKGEITSRFGNMRTFNGKVENWHKGVDLRAKTGVPVYAANLGKVIFAKNLFLAGNTTIVDHGAGVLTSYAHLSAIDVKVGQTLQRGEKLGAAGATGRVTGPHLHWGMRVNGVLVDPHQMCEVFGRFLMD